MSFLRKLFGGGGNGGGGEPPAAPGVEHNGFTIRATPYQEGGQWQLCGVIEKTIDGVPKSHRLVRADRFAGRDEAAEAAVRKAKLLIDQQGEKIFR